MKKFFAMLACVAMVGVLSFVATGCGDGKKTPTTPTKSSATSPTTMPTGPTTTPTAPTTMPTTTPTPK